MRRVRFPRELNYSRPISLDPLRFVESAGNGVLCERFEPYSVDRLGEEFQLVFEKRRPDAFVPKRRVDVERFQVRLVRFDEPVRFRLSPANVDEPANTFVLDGDQNTPSIRTKV